jgi:hypothetical protein
MKLRSSALRLLGLHLLLSISSFSLSEWQPLFASAFKLNIERKGTHVAADVSAATATHGFSLTRRDHAVATQRLDLSAYAFSHSRWSSVGCHYEQWCWNPPRPRSWGKNGLCPGVDEQGKSHVYGPVCGRKSPDKSCEWILAYCPCLEKGCSISCSSGMQCCCTNKGQPVCIENGSCTFA